MLQKDSFAINFAKTFFGIDDFLLCVFQVAHEFKAKEPKAKFPSKTF